ncbi:peptidase S8 and S53 subtilisin kexin sedolisin [Meiothermus sp. QL-1]|uniref:S8 family serine peptidase n=1 Tax=Meiothermus sp. QL-1 TaxID=2058095 RepID=UPI000E0C5C21|nr:S8 family serine peptidase [Meiothermus sp. QL-1]RDI95773.1 peptidase S8 and S53 subtilisin kexin sedolisin [Meiothermus sp. QL-1]
MRLVLLLLLLLSGSLAQGRMVEVIVELEGPALPSHLNKAELVGLLKAHLGRMKGRLKVQPVKGYWASQSLLVRLPEEQVGVLLRTPGVRRVYLNRGVRLAQPAALSTPVQSGSRWALEQIGAPTLWAAGLRGQGVRIGHLDTGVDANHPELRGKVAAFAVIEPGGTPRPSQPYDSAQHGTHTAGLLVGQSVGVAPEARLVSALVLPQGSGTLAQVLGGLDWVLEQGVQVVSMSLGLEGAWPEFIPVVERMQRMGVLPVFAIGNTPDRTTSPGNLPGVIGVGATDPAKRVAAFSGRGEVRWEGPSPQRVAKPDLVAPGVGVLSSVPGGGYMAMSGTSVSTALTAGGAALLLAGGHKPEAVRAALLRSAEPIASPASGRGLLRLDEALAALRPPQREQKALVVAEIPGVEALRPVLEGLGFRLEVVKSRPGPEKLQDYPLVVFLLPADWSQDWPDPHRRALRSYVEAGGRLLLLSEAPGRPLVESGAFGQGRASFVSGELESLPLEALRGVVEQLLR